MSYSKSKAKKEIPSILAQLNDQQQKEFAWWCAIRIMPYMKIVGWWSFWNDADKYIKNIYDALDLLSYGGIYTEKALRNKVEKSNLYLPLEIEETVQIEMQYLLQSVSSNFDDIHTELHNVECHSEIPEEFQDMYDQDDDYFDSPQYEQIIDNVTNASKQLKALQVIVKFFNNKQESIDFVVEQTLNIIKIDYFEEKVKDLKMLIAGETKSVFSLKPGSLDFLNKTPPQSDLEKLTQIYKELIEYSYEMDIAELEKRIKNII